MFLTAVLIFLISAFPLSFWAVSLVSRSFVAVVILLSRSVVTSVFALVISLPTSDFV